MIEKLRMINDKLLDSSLDKEMRKRYKLIGKILEDDKCFLKIDIEVAYGILRDLMVEEDKLKMVYMALIEENKKG